MNVCVRIVAALIGVVLLSAGLVKGTDLEAFIRQIRDYGILHGHAILAISAWALVAVECTLGIALIVGYRLRWTLSLTSGLMLLFVGATAWAWLGGQTEDCGCFGVWLKRSPLQAMIEDLVLMGICIFILLLTRRPREEETCRVKAITVLVAGILGLIMPAAFGYSVIRIVAPPADALSEHFRSVEVTGIEEDLDLTRGRYLVVLMDVDCQHCRQAVPELNMISEAEDLPQVVALCRNGESKREQFIADYLPLYPLGEIQDNVFWNLIDDGTVPRFLLVRHGRVQHIWDETLPDPQQLMAILAKS